jgi:hypothetical protein
MYGNVLGLTLALNNPDNHAMTKIHAEEYDHLLVRRMSGVLLRTSLKLLHTNYYVISNIPTLI